MCEKWQHCPYCDLFQQAATGIFVHLLTSATCDCRRDKSIALLEAQAVKLQEQLRNWREGHASTLIKLEVEIPQSLASERERERELATSP